jgi:hypothetical protein
MNRSDWTSTGGMSSKLAYACAAGSREQRCARAVGDVQARLGFSA